MKLRYEFEVMDVGDESVAVPVGESAEQFHGAIRLNETGKELFELIQQYDHPNQILEELVRRYPEDSTQELGEALCDFLNNMIREGIME